MLDFLEKITCDTPISIEQALCIAKASSKERPRILQAATRSRHNKSGNSVFCCSIINAKSGACSEDCSFCAQSCKHKTGIPTYPMLSAERIIAAYDDAASTPVSRLGVVTSGRRLSESDIATLCTAMQARQNSRPLWCASLGCLSLTQLKRLKNAGLNRFHHNLETSKSFFPSICTTHTYHERVSTVLAAKEAGLEVCCGGIFGIGESWEDRIELAFDIQALHVEAIPLNFLVPIPNTPAAKNQPLTKEDVLKIIALFRLICVGAEIRVCAGRERYLGEDEHEIFSAGACGMMVGGYLTTGGRPLEADMALLERANMVPTHYVQ